MCREHVLQLQHHAEELAAKNIAVAVVTFESQAAAEAYVRDLDLQFPLLRDPDRTLYRAYGMEEAGWGRLFGLSTILDGAKLLLKHRRLRRPTDNVKQLGGDILIDPQGIVRRAHLSNNPADRPAVSEIIGRAG